MSCAVLRTWASIVFSTLIVSSAIAADSATGNSIFRVYSLNDGPRTGMCFAIHQRQVAAERIVYFVTSARLIDPDRRQAQIEVGDGAVDIAAENILMPHGNALDLAILRVTTDAPVTVLPISFEPVAGGTDFAISVLGDAGEPLAISQRSRFVTTRTVAGDRAVAPIAHCEGAPAIAGGGAFGVVVSCPTDSVPVVSRLSALKSFLERNVPGLVAYPSTARHSTLNERDVNGPTLSIPFGEIREGYVDVPLRLAPDEALIGVSPRVITPRPAPSADVTVLGFRDRTVRLRFTLGEPLPALHAPWRTAQALVVVRLTVVSVPRS